MSALEKAKDVGRVAPAGSVGSGFRYARMHPDQNGGVYIVMATNRPISVGELYHGTRSRDYPIGIVTRTWTRTATVQVCSMEHARSSSTSRVNWRSSTIARSRCGWLTCAGRSNRFDKNRPGIVETETGISSFPAAHESRLHADYQCRLLGKVRPAQRSAKSETGVYPVAARRNRSTGCSRRR